MANDVRIQTGRPHTQVADFQTNAPSSSPASALAQSILSSPSSSLLQRNFVAGEIHPLDRFSVAGDPKNAKFFFFGIDSYPFSQSMYAAAVEHLCKNKAIVVLPRRVSSYGPEDKQTIQLPVFSTAKQISYLEWDDKLHDSQLYDLYKKASFQAQKIQKDLQRVWGFLHMEKRFYIYKTQGQLPKSTLSDKEIWDLLTKAQENLFTKPVHLWAKEYQEFLRAFKTIVGNYIQFKIQRRNFEQKVFEIQKVREKTLFHTLLKLSKENPETQIFIFAETSSLMLGNEPITARIPHSVLFTPKKEDPFVSGEGKASNAGEKILSKL